jgi:cation transport ATPase
MATWLTIIRKTSNRIGPARRLCPRAAHAVAPRSTRSSLPSPHRPAVASATESRRWTVPARSPRSVALSRGVPGVLGLRFQLGERSLRIAGGPQAALAAVEAIRNTGFEVHAWPDAPESTSAGAGSDHEHEHAATTGSGLPRLLSALALATAAEGLSFLVPDAPWSKWVGLAVAAAAIALAGFSTFSKGLTALRHGRLNINALMSVAVTGAFAIGQWPEAAMVMALYAIAELIEARAVDRARNAIKRPAGAWRPTPSSCGSLTAPGEQVPVA